MVAAANARWGSLYDALYGTDVIDSANGAAPGPVGSYNPARGNKVVAYAKAFLDSAVPLASGASFESVIGFRVVKGELVLSDGKQQLKRPEQFVGYTGERRRLICPSHTHTTHNTQHTTHTQDTHTHTHTHTCVLK